MSSNSIQIRDEETKLFDKVDGATAVRFDFGKGRSIDVSFIEDGETVGLKVNMISFNENSGERLLVQPVGSDTVNTIIK